MPNHTLDCRNQPCPQPVIMLKRLLEQHAPAQVQICVDNEPALENVSRFLASRGYTTQFTQHPGEWRITAVLNGTAPEQTQPTAPSRTAKRPEDTARTLALIVTPVIGAGDDELGAKLMKNFLATLPEFGDELWRIILLNGGVTLAAHGSAVLPELKALEDSGVSILVCGTCLEHFNLLEKKAVGQTTNMLDIVTSIQLADKVVRV